MLKKKSTIGGFNKTTKGKRPLVHQRDSEWDLNRFLPTIHHLALAVDSGTLNPMEYPSLGGESEAPATMSAGGSPVKPGHVGGGGMGAKTPGKSARSRPGGGGVQMANRGSSFGGDHEAPRFDRAGSSSDLQSSHAAGGSHHGHRRTGSNLSNAGAGLGRRLIVFVVGGVTRGEAREAYELSRVLGRDVLVGGTEMLKPWDFVNRLAVLGDGRGFAPKKADEDIDLDDIIIDD